jgi:hypothetical protein
MVDGVDLSLLLSESENKVPLGAFIWKIASIITGVE